MYLFYIGNFVRDTNVELLDRAPIYCLALTRDEDALKHPFHI